MPRPQTTTINVSLQPLTLPMPTSCDLFVALISCISTIFLTLVSSSSVFGSGLQPDSWASHLFFQRILLFEGVTCPANKKNMFSKTMPCFWKGFQGWIWCKKYLLDLSMWCSFCFNKMTWSFEFSRGPNPTLNQHIAAWNIKYPFYPFFQGLQSVAFQKTLPSSQRLFAFTFLWTTGTFCTKDVHATNEPFFQRPPFAWIFSPLPFFQSSFPKRTNCFEKPGLSSQRLARMKRTVQKTFQKAVCILLPFFTCASFSETAFAWLSCASFSETTPLEELAPAPSSFFFLSSSLFLILSALSWLVSAARRSCLALEVVPLPFNRPTLLYGSHHSGSWSNIAFSHLYGFVDILIPFLQRLLLVQRLTPFHGLTAFTKTTFVSQVSCLHKKTWARNRCSGQAVYWTLWGRSFPFTKVARLEPWSSFS